MKLGNSFLFDIFALLMILTGNIEGEEVELNVNLNAQIHFKRSGNKTGFKFPAVRLAGGGVLWEGRVEILFNGVWGTVCDDVFTSSVCVVICKMMDFSGGRCVNEDGSHNCLLTRDRGWTEARPEVPIWLNKLNCSGGEVGLKGCVLGGWGGVECGHKEDAGCMCNHTNMWKPAQENKKDIVKPVHSTGCDKSRHRIAVFDRSVPGMGRVEVKGEDGRWGVVCDDSWDDLDAAVFCQCLGYDASERSQAILYPGQHSDVPASDLPVMFGSVHCTHNDTLTVKNLWDCNTEPASVGHCDPAVESASVICGTHPAFNKPLADLPEVSLTCSGPVMSVCFKSSHSNASIPLSAAHFSLTPPHNCSLSSASVTSDGDICINISMSQCPPTLPQHYQKDLSMKQYCYDVTHSNPGHNPYRLLTDSVWTRRVCCVESMDGTLVTGSFLPDLNPVSSSIVYSSDTSSQWNSFNMTCYPDLTYRDSLRLERLVFPVIVRRGDRVTCFVEAHAWDPRLQLVVPQCRFIASPTEPLAPSYTFINNRCPTTDDLHVIFYTIDSLTWGVSFHLPQFEGQRELFISCDVTLCDPTRDKKHCDRSCHRKSASQTSRVSESQSERSRRAENRENVRMDENRDDTVSVRMVKKNEKKSSEKMNSDVEKNCMYSTVKTKNDMNDFIQNGPLLNKESGGIVNMLNPVTRDITSRLERDVIQKKAEQKNGIMSNTASSSNVTSVASSSAGGSERKLGVRVKKSGGLEKGGGYVSGGPFVFSGGVEGEKGWGMLGVVRLDEDYVLRYSDNKKKNERKSEISSENSAYKSHLISYHIIVYFLLFLLFVRNVV